MASPPVRDFSNLRYEDFRALASSADLSKYEKIGFPDSYRNAFEEAIFADIRRKLPHLDSTERVVIDIGPGCSDLPHMLVRLSEKHGHTLALLDSEEMLAHLPDAPYITKVPGLFPGTLSAVQETVGQADVILCYSVLHYIFLDTNLFSFIDAVIALLKPGGQALIGDIPNTSKRRRFFSSAAGKAFHKNFTGDDSDPVVEFLTIEHEKINDSVIFGLLQRAREAGADAYVLPQSADLPMANRREDILIIKP